MANPESAEENPSKPSPSASRKWVIAFAVLAILALSAREVFQWVIQDRLLYPPNRYLTPPADSGFPGSRFVKYTTAGGEERWGYRIDPETSAEPLPPGVPDFYLLLYGGGSSARLMAPAGERLAALTGASFFIVEHRGHGFNEGEPSAKGLIADAVDAYDVLKARGEFRNGVGVIGHSRGAGIALALAERRPVDRLLLMSAATSLKDIAHIRRGGWTSLILREDWPNESRLRSLIERPPSERPEAIGIIHGALDRVVPVRMAYQLAGVSEEAIELRVYEHQDHNNVLDPALHDVARFMRGGTLRPASTKP